MNNRTHLIVLCLNLLSAIVGIYISLRGLWHSWGTLVYLGTFDKRPVNFDSMVNTGLTTSDHMFALLFVGFSVLVVFSGFLLLRTLRRNR